MSSANNTTYEPVHKDEDAAHRKSEEAYEDLEFDPDTELMGNGRTKSYKESNKSRTVSRILAVANLVLFFVLLVTWLSVLRTTNQFCPGGPNPPWSKVREDGAAQYITKRFKPSLLFQSEPSPEVDKAWNETMQYDNSISVSKELAKKHNLPRTVEMPNDSNELLYGVSVFHQLHCLDVIRQALYPEHYFPHHSHSSLLQHKSHCLDFLRQAIMCKADVSMLYWWNSNFTTVEPDGTTRDSDYYLSLDPVQRVKASFVKWDIDHQCHDIDLIIAWLGKYGVDRPWQDPPARG